MSDHRRTIPTDAEVMGQVLQAFTHNVKIKELEPVLARHHILDLNPDQWYRVSDIVSLFDEITSSQDSMFNLVAIGIQISTYCVVPPELDQMSLDQFWGIIDQVYHMQHRGDVGILIPEKVGERHFTIASDTPYPDDFWYGIYYGWAKRLTPSGTQITAWYDRDAIRQDAGGEKTVIHVSWGDAPKR